VVALGDDWVDLIAVGTPPDERASPIALTLASAVPKGDRFDWLVEKATELGVERLVPLVTERSVVEPGAAKLARLRRAIVEASKQCRRNRLMLLGEPIRWVDLVSSAPASLKLLADPDGQCMQEIAAIPRGHPVILAIGPEGGFTPAEQSAAEISGWHRICFSPNTLRVETAGLAGSAALFARVEKPRK
jgi:16S rRNA (uracil1498-N3)-methyltransferase